MRLGPKPLNFDEKTGSVIGYLEGRLMSIDGDRILLRAGDRVVVQPTGLTKASRYMEQIMPFLVAADIGSAMYFRFSR